jgi:iron complex transport system substrate-binding protein
VYVGDGGAPSLEAIAALKPDLILYLLDRTADIYDKLTPIAPTLAIDSNSKDYWRPIMQDLGRVTGNETQVEQFLTEYDASAKAARERVASLAQKSPKLALLYLPAADSTFVFDERSSVSSPYVKLGFTMVAPEGTVIPENGFAQVAAEAIANIKADTIVALRFVDEAGNPLPLPIDPILNSLPNVRIVTQPLDPTRSSSAPLADKLALEQAAEILVPDSSAGGSSKN